MGRYQEAVQQFQLVLKSHPNNWLHQRNLASLYYTLGQPQLALTHARLALQGVPEAERAPLEAFITQLQASQSD
jgi:tetratricopeptide (TPR) repeat protein